MPYAGADPKSGISPSVGARMTAQRIFSSSNGCISGTQELKEILAGREVQLQQRMNEAQDLESFLIELIDTLEAILSSKSARGDPVKSVTYWSYIIDELDALGWHRIAHITQDLSQVQIELCDASQRKHLLTVQFPPGYPTVPLKIEPLLVPETESELRLLKHGYMTGVLTTSQESGLQFAVTQAEKLLDQFQEFWNVMEDIDEKTWVIDPEKPTRADRMRRCALDPLSPRSIPETRMFGPTAGIEPMRTKLFQNAALWDRTKLPRENLEALLELPNGFPTSTSVTKDEMNIECGQVPDQLCSHTKCQQPFHRVCLYEWLRSVPTTRQSFNTLFGACPYCSKTITTTAPKT
ncbi:hypothetical protein BGZ50_006486 [Haplosporangium sp. Z 11]|nr:hypothetical protein BGZ50_006486 [Haplosporangium sp. Z 11]